MQTKAVAKAKEAKIMEWREETPGVPKRLGLLALLLALLKMSYPTNPSCTARTLTVQALLASAHSSSTSGLDEEQEDGIAMGVVCLGKDLGRWRIVERFMENMYLQVAQIKMKAKDAAPTKIQSPRTRCYRRRVTCSNEEKALTSPSFLPSRGYHLHSRPSCRVSCTLTMRERKKRWISFMGKQQISKRPPACQSHGCSLHRDREQEAGAA